MSDRRQFLKNLAGITAGAVLAPKIVNELFEEVHAIESAENIKDLPTYPAEGTIQTAWMTLKEDEMTQEEYEKKVEEMNKQFYERIDQWSVNNMAKYRAKHKL